MLTREYRSWTAMKTRCYNPRFPSFADYGARGITVCDRWRDNFAAFLADMGPRPAGSTLERIDNDGNYEPTNCRWANRQEQNSNTRQNAFVVFLGERLAMAEACRRAGVSYNTVRWHIWRRCESHQAAFDAVLAGR